MERFSLSYSQLEDEFAKHSRKYGELFSLGMWRRVKEQQAMNQAQSDGGMSEGFGESGGDGTHNSNMMSAKQVLRNHGVT